MKKANRSNALLVELLIVVIFFMLASTVLLQVFTASSNQGKKAGAINDALVAAQNTADRLYASLSEGGGVAGEIRALQDLGFEADAASGWHLAGDGFSLSAYLDTQDRPAGRMHSAEVLAFSGEEQLFALPVARYEEAQP